MSGVAAGRRRGGVIVRRVGIFGWGVVAPRSPDIESFERNLGTADSWLEPFDGFGPDSFLIGKPEFSFDRYRDWIVERFKPNRFKQLDGKMGLPVKYAVGAFIQALEQNPGLGDELRRLGTRGHVYVGTGVGDLPTQYEQSMTLYRAQRCWNHFWGYSERNSVRRRFEQGRLDDLEVPVCPSTVGELEREQVEEEWWRFWAERSPELRVFLEEYRDLEALAVEGEVESGKISALKEKRRRLRRLREKWGAPQPPWEAVSANLIWNIDNIAAAQISMLGGITGPAVAVCAACSTFGVSLKLALDAIRAGEADAAVIGATDPPPHPLLVGAFYNARVISADAQISKPLTELRGTHVAGGSVIWIVADWDHMIARGFRPLGMEPVAVGVTSDADHIITPSKEGPTAAIRSAFRQSRVEGGDIVSWDLHATATPGDFNEVEMVRQLMPEEVLVTARKGTFGHGMAAGGGWELTAQYLGYQRREIFPTPLQREELNPQIAGVHTRYAFDRGCEAPDGMVGKLSMGVGGINACVVSRPLPVAVEPKLQETEGQPLPAAP